MSRRRGPVGPLPCPGHLDIGEDVLPAGYVVSRLRTPLVVADPAPPDVNHAVLVGEDEAACGNDTVDTGVSLGNDPEPELDVVTPEETARVPTPALGARPRFDLDHVIHPLPPEPLRDVLPDAHTGQRPPWHNRPHNVGSPPSRVAPGSCGPVCCRPSGLGTSSTPPERIDALLKAKTTGDGCPQRCLCRTALACAAMERLAGGRRAVTPPGAVARPVGSPLAHLAGSQVTGRRGGHTRTTL